MNHPVHMQQVTCCFSQAANWLASQKQWLCHTNYKFIICLFIHFRMHANYFLSSFRYFLLFWLRLTSLLIFCFAFSFQLTAKNLLLLTVCLCSSSRCWINLLTRAICMSHVSWLLFASLLRNLCGVRAFTFSRSQLSDRCECHLVKVEVTLSLLERGSWKLC